MLFKLILIRIKQLWINFWTRYQGSPAKLEKAKKKADRLSLAKGKRYRVFFLKGRYRVMTRLDVQRKKHSGEWNQGVNMTKLENMQFYDSNPENIQFS